MTMDLFTFLEDTNTLKVDPKPWMQGGDYILSRVTNDTLPGIIDDCIAGGLYALDLETTGLNSCVYDGETTSKIVGCCLSPDGKRGYYIPLRHKTGQEHNVSWSQWKREMQRLIDSPARAIFHNGKFDQEFLQNCGGEPLGEWDEPKKWEDTLILAYLRDTRSKSKGLKHLSKTELGMEMIELDELFPEDRRKGDLDFSDLDPSWEPVTWYGASDAICTWNLYQKLHPQVIPPSMGQRGQGIIYAIEKLCVASTRWMERARIMTDQVKARELIRIGQREWLASLEEVYESSSAIVGRDVRPGYYRIMQGAVQGLEGLRFDTEEVSPSYMDRVETARATSIKSKLDPLNEKKKVKTVTKRVASLNKETKGATEDVEFPVVYDVLSAQQLGSLLRECKVPGLTATEKSGQVATSADELEKVLESVGDKFPFAGKIKRFREVSKALSTYLLPLIEDSHPDGSLRAYFNAFSIDTGRFNAPSSKNPKMDGGTRFPFHGTPATYDPTRPECMGRIRECIIARPGKVIAGIDFSGVELRIVTNISGEPKWLREFFHCSGCDRMFPMGTAEDPVPMAPPSYCPDCGSDKIGDLHTLTALSIYGEDAPKKENWKQLRGFGKCVHPDTLILGGNLGLVRLGQFPTTLDEGFLKAPQGLQVMGPDGSLVPVRETYNGGVKELFHVVTRRGIVTCSDQHAFKMVDGSLRTIDRGLQKGDVLCDTPYSGEPYLGSWDKIPCKPSDDTPEFWFQTTPEMAYFAGLFLGDGCKGGVNSVGLAHGHTDKTDPLGVPYAKWQDVLMGVCSNVGLRPVPRKKGIYLGSRSVMRFLSCLSLVDGVDGARTLRIPQWVLNAGREGILQFLGGLFDTDGYIGKRDSSVRWCTKDAVFAGQIAASLSAFGLQPSVHPSWNKTYQRYYFVVGLRASSAHALRGYSKHPGKLARFRSVPAVNHQQHNKVLQVIPAGSGLCVDLSLDSQDHLYWTNGVITHNSCNFALCYGGSGNAVVTATGCDKNEGYRIKDQFDKTYKVLSGWWKTQAIAAKKYKFVTTAFGRRYPLPDIDHEMGGFRAKAERNAVNGPIQGCLHFDSKIPTSLGLLTVKELWDRQAGGEYDRFKVWTGKAWVDGRALFSGVKELRVTTFSNGITIRTSPEHLFRVLGKEGDLRWVRQDDLKVGFYAATDSGNRDNQDYQYTQVTDKVVTNQFVTMYDIEVFDDDHAFVCDGMVVHNTSADITKIAMGLVYRECKQRGWLDKVHMLITMHDELVFEIDKDILEEAVDIFVRLMCRNELVQKLNWPVPLTSDVEMGPNWMVEWDLKKIRKKGECPPELEGCFKGIGPKAKADPMKGNAQPVEKKREPPVFTYKLKGFTLGEIEPLARLIALGATAPVSRLKVVGPNDEDLTESLSVVWSGKIPMVGEA